MLVVLRVASERLDLDQCLQWLPAELLEASWRPGERRGDLTSGFNLLLAEGGEAALVDALRELRRIAAPLRSLVGSGIGVELDVGVEVGVAAPRSVLVPTALMEEMNAIGVELRVTAYPCSDVKEEEPGA
jgi:hypothetical protein